MERVHCYLKPQSMGLKQPFLHGYGYITKKIKMINE